MYYLKWFAAINQAILTHTQFLGCFKYGPAHWTPYFILQSEASIGRQRNLKFRFGKDKSLLDTGGDVSIAGRGFMIATATLLIELDLWVCGVASFQGAFIPL